MHDLSAAGRVDELRRAGVTGLKIEGRLKSPDWIRQAVRLFREAIKGDNPVLPAGKPGQSPQSAGPAGAGGRAGAYTGRAMTSDYLDGRRDNLTGPSGRAASRDSGEPDGR